MRQVTLLTRPGCHLCDDARLVVGAVTSEHDGNFLELNVDDDRELRGRYGDLVPVVLVDGIEHGYFIIDAERLRAALRRT